MESITVPLAEYEILLERSIWLMALEAAGVDNWQGLEEAIIIRNEWEAGDIK